MKKTNLFFGIVLSVLLAFGFTACEPDPVVNNDPPSLSLISGDSYVSGNAQVDPSANIKIKLKGVVGTGDLYTLSYYENGLKLDLETRLGAGVSGNPDLLRDGNESGFEKEITFISQADGTSDYKFVLVDVNGLQDSVEFTLTLNPQETPLNFEKKDITVYNADAPGGYYGSIDLQTGETVASNSADGDIQDLGLVDGNWAKKIKPENGSEMVIPGAEVTYENVTTLEALLKAYDNGTAATEADVVEGAIFLFKTKAINGQSDYFLIKNTKIVEVDTNKDYYLFDLKGYKFN